MRIRRHYVTRSIILMTVMVMLVALSTRLRADTQTTGTCGGSGITNPFTDVPNTNIFFCAIAEAYFSGLTNGTTATTYSPNDPVPREQMAAFITRTLDLWDLILNSRNNDRGIYSCYREFLVDA